MRNCRALLLSIMWVLPGVAAATPYVDEAAFQAAAPGAAIETFDTAFGAGDTIGALTSLGITFQDPGDGLPGVFAYSGSPGASAQSQPNNLANRPTLGNLSTQSWVFSATGGELITAVGLWNIGTDDTLDLNFLDAADDLIETLRIAPATVAGAKPNFGGIVSAVGATTIEIAWAGSGFGNGLMGIDDLQVELAGGGSVNPVPLPSGVWLLGLGLAAFFARRQRTGFGPVSMRAPTAS